MSAPEWVEEAIALKAEGLGWRAIGKRLGVNEGTVRYQLAGPSTGDLITLECPDCGASFERRRSRIGEGKCRSCSSNRKRLKVTKRCECGETFETWPSELRKGGGKYCSRACFAKYMVPSSTRPEVARKIGAAKRGRKNPMFKTGLTASTVYRSFNIHLKGAERCRNCGATEGLCLHHAVPRSLCRAAIKDLRNGLPLCRSCHASWHGRSITIYRDVFTEEEWDFISTLTLTGQKIGPWLDERYPERPATA